MRPLSLSVVLLLCVLSWSAPAAENWLQSTVNGHWYAATQFSFSWDKAEVYAQSFGGHLATIRNAAENSWVQGILAPAAESWIGYNDVAVEGAWQWASGDPATFTNWAAGEPNNAGNEDNATFLPGSGEWNDNGGAKFLPAILEVVNGPPGPGDNLALVGEWKQSPVSGAWYAATDVGMSRFDAEVFAKSLHADLGSIRDITENNWIRNNFATTSEVWIGYTDALVEGVWLWDNGTPPTYTHWASGEPNNSGDEDYASMLTTGFWNDIGGTPGYRVLLESPNPPTVTFHGSGCAGTLGIVPELEFGGSTSAGSQIVITLIGGLGGSQAFLLLAGAPGATPLDGACVLNLGLPLFPALLGPIPLGGAGPGNGTASAFGQLPQSVAAPFPIGVQAFVIDAGSIAGYANTAALILEITP